MRRLLNDSLRHGFFGPATGTDKLVLNRSVSLFFFASTVLALTFLAHAQTPIGEPIVHDNTIHQVATPIFLDATQFPENDMCLSIADACGRTGGGSPIPGGTTIDARGFTGNQVCKATSIPTMLSSCATNGGKLLLGLVNLYADGPASGNYTDGNGSGAGTPAFILPTKFWGIEGVSRGAGDAGATLGTFLSVCTGSNTPVGSGGLPPASGSPSCSTGFPQRKYGISNITVSGTTNPVTMTITISSLITAYVGELAMLKGAPSGDNGTFAIQYITAGTSTMIQMVVPSGATTCTTGSCGTLVLGTPILGFGPPPGVAYGTAYNGCGGGKLCSSFGEHIKNLGFNCQGASGLDGCIGWQNIYAQEESGADTFIVDNFNFVGVDVHSFASQNFGPILNAEVYTGSTNTNCLVGTTGIYLGDSEMRGLNGWTINQSTEQPNPITPKCASTPVAAVLLDAQNTEVRNGHCEAFANCVLVGANNGSASGDHVTGVGGGPTTEPDVVQVSANNPTNGQYVIERIRKNAVTHSITDNINNVTLNDAFVSFYAYAGIRAGAVRTGVHANTDLAGCARYSR